MKDKFSGYWGDCSEEQVKILNDLKHHIKNELKIVNKDYDDIYLLRFCRARKFIKDDVILMFSNFIKFRKDYNVDKICENKFPDYSKIQEWYVHGYMNVDKLGRPIYIEQNGYINPDDVFDLFGGDKELIVKYYISSYERLIHIILPECSRIKGSWVEQTCTILDLKGMSISKLLNNKFKEFLKLTIKIAQDNYPELMGSMFIINAPWNFRFIYYIVALVLDEKTKKKINVLGSDYKKTLLKYIDEEQLPEFLGGKFKGKIVENHGPWKELFDYSIKKNLIKVKHEDLLKTQEKKIKEEEEEEKEKKIKEEKQNKLIEKNNDNNINNFLFDMVIF